MGFVERNIGHLREGGEHLNGREGIADLDLLDVENGDGENLFLIEAFDISAGDGEGLEFEDFPFAVFFSEVAAEGAGAVWAWSAEEASAVKRVSRAVVPSERVGVVVIEVGSISNIESLFVWYCQVDRFF